MHNEHGLILLDDDCNQIAQAADEARMAAGTPVAMILINALRSLSHEELVTLGKAIADRCGHRLEPVICPTNDQVVAPPPKESDSK